MNSAMEQTRYWLWTGRKFNNTRPPPPPLFNSPITTVAATSSYHESWEEQAFAEDSAGLLGGCIWPPRSYSCSFCRREFRSAQALGGHMNVHRRDRARLKQSSSPGDEGSDQYPDKVSTLEYYSPSSNPNPNPNPNSGLVGSSLPSASEHTMVSPTYASSTITPRSFATPIPVRPPSSLELTLELATCKVREVGSKGKRDREKDDELMTSSKRCRATDTVFPSVVKPSADDLQLIGRSKVLKLSPSPVEELDLELRLGDPPRVK